MLVSGALPRKLSAKPEERNLFVSDRDFRGKKKERKKFERMSGTRANSTGVSKERAHCSNQILVSGLISCFKEDAKRSFTETVVIETSCLFDALETCDRILVAREVQHKVRQWMMC